MLVVVGPLSARAVEDGIESAGLASQVALAAAAAGVRVEVIGKVGRDSVGDAVLLSLARGGVGHVATSRDPAHPTPMLGPADDATDPTDEGPEAGDRRVATADAQLMLEPADVELALRYVTDYRVVVAVHLPAETVGEVVSAAAWAGAHLVVVLAAGVEVAVPDDALVVVADEGEAGVGVAEAIGRYAAAIERGDDGAGAYAELVGGRDGG
jgi:sugar/nucleoside kinase (ribokinase family)